MHCRIEQHGVDHVGRQIQPGDVKRGDQIRTLAPRCRHRLECRAVGEAAVGQHGIHIVDGKRLRCRTGRANLAFRHGPRCRQPALRVHRPGAQVGALAPKDRDGRGVRRWIGDDHLEGRARRRDDKGSVNCQLRERGAIENLARRQGEFDQTGAGIADALATPAQEASVSPPAGRLTPDRRCLNPTGAVPVRRSDAAARSSTPATTPAVTRPKPAPSTARGRMPMRSNTRLSATCTSMPATGPSPWMSGNPASAITASRVASHSEAPGQLIRDRPQPRDVVAEPPARRHRAGARCPATPIGAGGASACRSQGGCQVGSVPSPYDEPVRQGGAPSHGRGDASPSRRIRPRCLQPAQEEIAIVIDGLGRTRGEH